MAQADGVVANGTGSAVRSDINTQYAALWSNHSGSTEPSSGKVAYQTWADTNSGYLKIRNAANNGWIQLFKLDGTDIHFVNLSGSTNNTVCTVTGADAIQGEANLTFDGTHLNLGNTGSNWVGPLNVGTGASGAAQVIDIYSNSDTYGGLWFSDGTSGADRYVGAIQYHHDSNYMKFDTNGAERVRIQSDGHVKINDGDLVIGTAGHGIDFSAQTATSASGASTTSELLDHYEEGTFTPYIRTSGDSTEPSYAGQYGIYSRVGDIVQFSIWVKANSTIASSSGSLWIAGLPFTAQSMTGSWQGSTVLQYYHNVANINSSATSISAIGPNSGGTVISFNWLSAGAFEATLAGNNIQANTELIFGGTYKAA